MYELLFITIAHAQMLLKCFKKTGAAVETESAVANGVKSPQSFKSGSGVVVYSEGKGVSGWDTDFAQRVCAVLAASLRAAGAAAVAADARLLVPVLAWTLARAVARVRWLPDSLLDAVLTSGPEAATARAAAAAAAAAASAAAVAGREGEREGGRVGGLSTVPSPSQLLLESYCKHQYWYRSYRAETGRADTGNAVSTDSSAAAEAVAVRARAGALNKARESLAAVAGGHRALKKFDGSLFADSDLAIDALVACAAAAEARRLLVEACLRTARAPRGRYVAPGTTKHIGSGGSVEGVGSSWRRQSGVDAAAIAAAAAAAVAAEKATAVASAPFAPCRHPQHSAYATWLNALRADPTPLATGLVFSGLSDGRAADAVAERALFRWVSLPTAEAHF
ncbi:hypothetical protein T492DRAFT_834018 [Pavlovales sp. CCMP2436]|nr:hypothetical protein T492DRAFT_834018 [Pavlovales sp. CCMP2436]